MKAVVRVCGHRRNEAWDWTAEVEDKQCKKLAEDKFRSMINRVGKTWDRVCAGEPVRVSLDVPFAYNPEDGIAPIPDHHTSVIFERMPINAG